MPNGTLCGKAVVEMVLGQESNLAVYNIQEQLVKEGNLPRSYIISKERIGRCQKLESVEVQDRNGEVGMNFETLLTPDSKNNLIPMP